MTERATIDFGIDLGTTNSGIAYIDGAETKIIKNNDNIEITPSVVHINRKGAIIVGEGARNRQLDKHNTHSEFKRQMGTTHVYYFERIGKHMTPVELSAEVLKQLKQDVLQRKGEDLSAIVVTVPAAFELPQTEATKEAAKLAGFSLCQLLQEPVAAALAYGFQKAEDNVFWMVYDLGGGTFDAAVIQVQEGIVKVINHGGDNHLGGKDIDWEIIERLITPNILKNFHFKDFHRGNPKWDRAFALLKSEVESAKIKLSRNNTAEILIDRLTDDESGRPLAFEMDLEKGEIERIAEPFILRTINICKKVLREKNLSGQDIERVVLVGGPTLMPYLRERLEDPKDGLGIKVDFSVDPLSAVARGAAIFAGTQRIDREIIRPTSKENFNIKLEYKPVGIDSEPLIGGKIIAAEDMNFKDYTIEFINEGSKPKWESGKIKLEEDGTFITTLWAEKNKKNNYTINLYDGNGNKVILNPNSFEYTIGLVISEPPLTHSVGVAMADNRVDFILEKGTPLPAKKRVTHHTVTSLRKDSENNVIRIPIVEGNSIRGDRNRLIGFIEIPGANINRDLPLGTEVDITIEIDKSRLIKCNAYIPILDEEFEEVLKLRPKNPEPDLIKKDFYREKERLGEIKTKTEEVSNKKATIEIKKLNNEGILEEIETTLKALEVDRDAAEKCDDRLRKLKDSIDAIEDIMEWPILLQEANELMELSKEIVAKYGNHEDKKLFQDSLNEVKNAIDSRDPDVLRRSLDELNNLRLRIFWDQPAAWVGYFQYIESCKDEVEDKELAKRLFNQGYEAIENNDIGELQAVCRQLRDLMPQLEEYQVQGYGGSTIKR